MLISHARNKELSFLRMELALLYLVRGTLAKRSLSDHHESVVFDSNIYALINLIIELHRFRERRAMIELSWDGKSSIANDQIEEITAEIMRSVELIHDKLRENSAHKTVHMKLISVKLERLTQNYMENLEMSNV